MVAVVIDPTALSLPRAIVPSRNSVLYPPRNKLIGIVLSAGCREQLDTKRLFFPKYMVNNLTDEFID